MKRLVSVLNPRRVNANCWYYVSPKRKSIDLIISAGLYTHEQRFSKRQLERMLAELK